MLSYCGLNLQKHKGILDDMEAKGLLAKTDELWGSKIDKELREGESKE